MQTYSAAEVANRLGVSSKWVVQMAAQRRIPHLLIAHKYRFTEEHLAQIIEDHTRPVVEDEAAEGEKTREPAFPEFPGVTHDK